jgi:hypothetical protein
MMERRTVILAALAGALAMGAASGQAPASASGQFVTIDQPDAQRTKDELSNLLERYPPGLRGALAADPSLLSNQQYLAPYPALVNFLSRHPEVARNPSFYVDAMSSFRRPHDRESQVLDLWREVLNNLAIFAGFGMAIGVVVWLIRTVVDYRRWSRLAKVQTDAHTKLLDRFTANDDLLAYIQSPAGAKFLESSPIKLDAGPRSVGAPLGRILWSVQGGLVLLAAGIGLQLVSSRVPDDAAQPMHVLGVLGVAIGVGFLISAAISFWISQRLGLIEQASGARRGDTAAVEGFSTRQ